MSLVKYFFMFLRGHLQYVGIAIIIVAVTLTLMKREGMLITRTMNGERLLRCLLFATFMLGMVLLIIHIMLRYL